MTAVVVGVDVTVVDGVGAGTMDNVGPESVVVVTSFVVWADVVAEAVRVVEAVIVVVFVED